MLMMLMMLMRGAHDALDAVDLSCKQCCVNHLYMTTMTYPGLYFWGALLDAAVQACFALPHDLCRSASQSECQMTAFMFNMAWPMQAAEMALLHEPEPRHVDNAANITRHGGLWLALILQLAHADCEHQYLPVTGCGGSGKTLVITHVLDYLQRQHESWKVVVVDTYLAQTLPLFSRAVYEVLVSSDTCFCSTCTTPKVSASVSH